MRIFSSLAILVVAILAVGACNSTERTASKVATSTNSAAANKANPVAPNPPDNTRRINVQQAQELAARGQAYFVDVRNQPAYDQGHIPGAKLIPLAEVVDRIGELPRDKTIITYCA
ncbi:MAG: rhodanese-like domain-containing protein [Acidobacteriota bacterium]|nr:rhodanese-like domain-containing protein [Acidobacteriota bacterium]